ncbi:hypothetical protein OUZ56_032024 [Daphnia magna]|uniref:Syndetin C-terminal domain-containing protein n=1 Tax=Daphnia magna TaxID=35525 RepID=A0ABQ9ZW00_9CRUS|nr:hypothetical protein OUZ56_032024 [Daphnia magna]
MSIELLPIATIIQNNILSQVLSDYDLSVLRVCYPQILPPEIYNILWDKILCACYHTLLDGKCTNEGRALMQLDFRHFQVKVESLTRLRPLPDPHIVETYIKAYYLPKILWKNGFKNKRCIEGRLLYAECIYFTFTVFPAFMSDTKLHKSLVADEKIHELLRFTISTNLKKDVEQPLHLSQVTGSIKTPLGVGLRDLCGAALAEASSASTNSISFKGLNAVRQNMTTTPVRVQVPGLNLQQEIGSSIRYTSATCQTNSVATPSQYYLIKQRPERRNTAGQNADLALQHPILVSSTKY